MTLPPLDEPTPIPRARPSHWRWLGVLLSGLGLWILSVVVTAVTANPNLIPTVVLLGSFLVPATAVIFYMDHNPATTLSGQRVFFAFLYGGVLGVLAAALLEAWLLQDGPLIYVAVGLIEELAKLIALLLVAWGIRHYSVRDGIILGTAVGFGFAAFESSGYALNALFTPNGPSLVSLVFAEVLRGILAPFGHGLWTGILGGVLFREAARRGRIRLTWAVVRTFLAVSLLHALWDSMRGLAVFLTVLITSTAAAAAQLENGRMPLTSASLTAIFLIIEVGGIVVISAVGLAMLRRAWRRSVPLLAA